ncbi:hypothetical protein HK105_205391 [Polyrhizophydium stewartii]|uniref:Uncharacterized protein n=1 Tax=Polyrhizophydium stewartii TaxID=2732419 RepID=A0ABR4N694_9FUNG
MGDTAPPLRSDPHQHQHQQQQHHQQQQQRQQHQQQQQHPRHPAAGAGAAAQLPIPSAREFVAGGLSGIAQVAVGHPLDTVRVRLQLSSEFRGLWDCLVQTVRHEGVLGLYKGMAAPLAGVAFVNAVLFSAYGWCRNMQVDAAAGQTVRRLSLGQIALAGAGAGFVNAFVAGPIEMLKIRLQAQRANPATTAGAYAGPIDVVRRIVRDHGVRNGLFRGTTATVLKEIPAYAGFYAAFEAAKRLIAGTPAESPADLPPHLLMVAGACGGMAYWTCCYPLDVAKSRIQRTNPDKVSGNVAAMLRQIYSEAGWRGLFKGYGASLLRSIPSAAATFTVFEISMRAMHALPE